MNCQQTGHEWQQRSENEMVCAGCDAYHVLEGVKVNKGSVNESISRGDIIANSIGEQFEVTEGFDHRYMVTFQRLHGTDRPEFYRPLYILQNQRFTFVQRSMAGQRASQ